MLAHNLIAQNILLGAKDKSACKNLCAVYFIVLLDLLNNFILNQAAFFC